MRTFMMALALLPAMAAAEVLAGKVIDADTGEPIPGATVTVEGTGLGAYTDGEGRFSIEGVNGGSVIVAVNSVGHRRLEREVPASEEGLELTMRPVLMGRTSIVVTATGMPELYAESPVRTSVVTREMMERRNVPDLFGALKLQTGVRTENNCQNCGFTQVRIHGLEGQYTQILLNGSPVMSSLAKVYGLEQIPSEMVDRVEVVKGGGSALYGGAAVAGVVNMVTTRPRSSSTTVEYEHSDIDGAPENRASFNVSSVSGSGSTAGYIFGSWRRRSQLDVNGDGFSDLARLRNESLGFQLFVDPSETASLELGSRYLHEKRRGGDRIDFPEHLVDIAEGTETWRYGGDARWSHRLSRRFDYMARFSLAHTDRESFYGGLGGEEPGGPDYDPAAGYGKTSNPLLSGEARINLTLGGHVLSLGSQATREELTDESYTEEATRPLEETYTDVGAYLQDDMSLASDRLGLILGARADSHSEVAGIILSPRAALRWDLNPALTMRAGVTTGFNPPQVFDEDLHIEVVGGSPRIIVNADDLQEERSTSLYGGFEYDVFLGNSPARFSVSGFSTDLRDAFALEEAGESQYGELIFERVNSGGASVSGVEAEAGFRSGALELSGGATVQRSRYDDEVEVFDGVWSDRIMRTPEVYGHLVVDLVVSRKLDLLASAEYTGPMQVPHDTTEPEIVESDPFLTLDVNGSYSLDGGWLGRDVRLKLGVENLTNEYQEDLDAGAERDAGYVYGPARPRTLIGGIRVEI